MSNDINLGGTIRPGTTDPVFEDTDGKGGARVVADIAARNAITAPYKKIGMLVVVQSPLALYQLASTGPDVWVPFSSSVPGRYTSTIQTVGTTPTALPDTIAVPEGTVVSLFIRIVLQDVIGPNAGDSGELIYRSVWQTVLGVTTRVSVEELNSKIASPSLDPEQGSTVDVSTSSPSSGVVQVDLVGVSGETINWTAGP